MSLCSCCLLSASVAPLVKCFQPRLCVPSSWAAGVDPQVALFHRLPEGSSETGGKDVPWAYLSSKRPHTHDVRALCVAGGKALPEGARLFSGGNDTQLFAHSVEHFLKVGMNPSSAPPFDCCPPGSSAVSVPYVPFLQCQLRRP